MPDQALRNRRIEQISSELELAAKEFSPDELPEFFAVLERARRNAELRLNRQPVGTDGPPRLLDAKQTAAVLAVNPATVYRLAKGPLRTAVVELSEGIIRFDPDRLNRFIEGRRRG